MTKLKVMTKATKPLTTGQSKQNSKSKSRIEEQLNIASSNKINKDILSNMSNKAKKPPEMHSLITNKKTIFNHFCVSLTGKLDHEILKKINLKCEQDMELNPTKANLGSVLIA